MIHVIFFYLGGVYRLFKALFPRSFKVVVKKKLRFFLILILIGGYGALYGYCRVLADLGMFAFYIKSFGGKYKSNIQKYPIENKEYKKNSIRKIGIDIRPLQIVGSRSRGIGFYTKYLTDELLSLSDSNYDYTFYSADNPPNEITQTYGLNYIFKRKSQRFTWLWNTAYLPVKILESDVGLFHATDPFCIVKPTQFYRTIATVYDVIPLIYPKQYLLPTTLYRRYAYNKSYNMITYVNAVITISDSSKKDIARLLNIPRDKIFVTHLAASKEFKPVENPDFIQSVKKKYNIRSDYILYVGGIDYRKNIIAVLKAYSSLLSTYKNLNLVIIGEDIFNTLEPMKRKIDRVIRELKLSERLILLGYVPTNDLVTLYSGAQLFVYPSLYEGFGLPVLEAMACKCPVICSNTSSLPEVAGEAAMYVNPNKVNEITHAMINILNNTQLANHLRNLGYKQAKKFSWEKTAKDTIAVYNQILNYENTSPGTK